MFPTSAYATVNPDVDNRADVWCNVHGCGDLPPMDDLWTGTGAPATVPITLIINSVHTNPMNFTTLTRTAIRTALIQKNKQTCSDIVKGMGLDPKRHKGTIHAIMVDMEDEGILSATMKGTRRNLWSIHTNQIRKRDRLIAALIGWQFVKMHKGGRGIPQPSCTLKESKRNKINVLHFPRSSNHCWRLS